MSAYWRWPGEVHRRLFSNLVGDCEPARSVYHGITCLIMCGPPPLWCCPTPAGGRRRAVYHAGVGPFHVGVPHRLQLSAGGYAGHGVLGVWVAMIYRLAGPGDRFSIRLFTGGWRNKHLI